jgi:hypothetical protein
VVQVTPKAPAQAEPDAATARRTDEINQSEPQDAKEKQAVPVERPVEIAQDNRAATRRKSRRQSGTPVAVAQQRKAAPDKARASQEARQQLAELVQASRDDDNLPRLSDLIDDSSGAN